MHIICVSCFKSRKYNDTLNTASLKQANNKKHFFQSLKNVKQFIMDTAWKLMASLRGSWKKTPPSWLREESGRRQL